MVKDYNTLIREFPLNEMITAYDVNKIAASLVPIFSHMKKIRTSKYPIQRFIKLIEVLSRDLSNQLLKVRNTPGPPFCYSNLSNRLFSLGQILTLKKLMGVGFEEFERITNETSTVFATWEDEYDKLIGMVKEMVKKKRDDSLKINWQLNLSHKLLQSRLEYLKKYRFSLFQPVV